MRGIEIYLESFRIYYLFRLRFVFIIPIFLIGSLLLISDSFGNSGANSDLITILHTNDVHSHFRSEATPLGLGGIARLKTAVKKIKEKNPNTVLVDGGDWSEGSIYYTLGIGTESVRMMDHIGYDVAVIGN